MKYKVLCTKRFARFASLNICGAVEGQVVVSRRHAEPSTSTLTPTSSSSSILATTTTTTRETEEEKNINYNIAGPSGSVTLSRRASFYFKRRRRFMHSTYPSYNPLFSNEDSKLWSLLYALLNRCTNALFYTSTYPPAPPFHIIKEGALSLFNKVGQPPVSMYAFRHCLK